MTAILWHGRGGQGAFTAARILGAAYAESGGYALAFPSFGPERRGAPMRAFVRLDSRQIVDRSEIAAPDYTVYLDETLAPAELGASAFAPTLETYELAAKHQLPTVNTVILAKLASALSISAEHIAAAINAVMPKRIRARNIAAVLEIMQ